MSTNHLTLTVAPEEPQILRFLNALIENITKAASEHPNSQTRAAIHAVGAAVQEASNATGIGVVQRYQLISGTREEH